MTHDQTYQDIKAAVLAGMSGYAAAKKYGVDPLSVAKRLSLDPDILKAKADGTVKSRAKRHKTATHYINLDYVKAVLEEGMTQTAAATKYGKAQAQVAFGVRKAREELSLPGRPTPTTPTPQDPNNDPVRAHLADAIQALQTAVNRAQVAGLSPTVIIKVVSEAL